jgi:hypothetical protein
MSCYISQYLQSDYAKVHVCNGMISTSDQIYRTVGVVNSIQNERPFHKIATYTDVICFVLGEGPQPVVSTALASLYPEWSVYSYDKQMQESWMSMDIFSIFPNFMTIDTPLNKWRTSEDNGLTFNVKGQEYFNAKNVIIVAFDYFDQLHELFKGIDPLNINMFTIHSNRKKLKELDTLVTKKYIDKGIKNRCNVVKFWDFKRLYKKTFSNQKKWVFHLNRRHYEGVK